MKHTAIQAATERESAMTEFLDLNELDGDEGDALAALMAMLEGLVQMSGSRSIPHYDFSGTKIETVLVAEGFEFGPAHLSVVFGMLGGVDVQVVQTPESEMMPGDLILDATILALPGDKRYPNITNHYHLTAAAVAEMRGVYPDFTTREGWQSSFSEVTNWAVDMMSTYITQRTMDAGVTEEWIAVENDAANQGKGWGDLAEQWAATITPFLLTEEADPIVVTQHLSAAGDLGFVVVNDFDPNQS